MTTTATDYKIMFPIRCEKCLSEFRNPATVLTECEQEYFENYAQVKVGHTALGIQIWCKRHNCNVLNTAVDFVEDKKTKTMRVLSQRGALSA